MQLRETTKSGGKERRRDGGPLPARGQLTIESGTSRVRITSMPEMGKLLMILGVVIALVGLLLWSGIGRGWLGQMPGDINYSRGNFQFHFPIVTCLVISAVLTFLIWLFRK